MSTAPANASPTVAQETTVEFDTTVAEEVEETTEIPLTDTTAYSDVPKETTDREGPVTTDVPEGTTDIMVTESRGISDGPEGTTDMEMSESPAVSDPYEETTGEACSRPIFQLPQSCTQTSW
ncbi:unnamed protein product [Haemonchus placei]|uniref:Uncharacterized protein n=1 Tax=Haemonchus placei TaxID=6290 RepID=A0A0N4VUD2_HAEPC|nr:unnamed protein product [Haemonchus placei]